MKKATIVAFDQFTDVDVFLPWDLFNRARLREKNWQVKIVGTQARHTSVCGIELATHGLVEECRTADLVFFASGPGTRALVQDGAYLRRLQLDPARQVVCSMCSGALVLAALGLLDGLSATTYPTAVAALRAYGVEVHEDRHLVTHGNVGTAAGCLAAVDLVGWSLARVLGKQTSQEVIASVRPVGQGQACIY